MMKTKDISQLKKLHKFQSTILEFANCQIKEEICMHNGSAALQFTK
jgi:hypothetical protein